MNYTLGTIHAIIKIITTPGFFFISMRCISAIMRNFFLLQYYAAITKKIPVTNVDHPLDAEIPFLPKYVDIYMDFSGFWIRRLAAVLRKEGKQAARAFIADIMEIYERAATVYKQNMSTTARPRYLKSPHFVTIHLLDPHLMCIPSLHVMLMIYTGVRCQVPGVREHALRITDSVLFIKQHSVNCISAAMYAMTCMLGEKFPPEIAGQFADQIFTLSHDASVPRADEIRAYIKSLYHQFLSGYDEKQWEKPLLDFLQPPCAKPAN
jgi:hypothetical protein